MHEQQVEVANWMKKANQEFPDKPTTPTEKVARLRVDLIQEELDEFKEALGFYYPPYYDSDGFVDFPSFDKDKCDLVECADAIGDLLYVVYGAAVALGIDIKPVWDEVCRSNNSKFADGYSFREDGKLIKSPNFSPPQLKEIIEKQSNHVS